MSMSVNLLCLFLYRMMPSLLGLPLKNNDRARSPWSCTLKEVGLGKTISYTNYCTLSTQNSSYRLLFRGILQKSLDQFSRVRNRRATWC